MATHNGYTNYMTWSVIATIDNTESLYNFFQDWKKEINAQTDDKNERIAATADMIKKVIESMSPSKENPIWGPLLNAVVENEINYREIAESMVNES